MSAEEESVARLSARVGRLDRVLEQTLASPSPEAPASVAAGRVVVTGAGIAAGPARFLATYLRDAQGLVARYCPPSAFATHRSPPIAETLVVFSERLSANAQLVLSRADRYEHVALFSATTPDPKGTEAERHVAAFVDAGGQLIRHGPDREEGMLVRVLGPAASMMQAARWAMSVGTLDLDGALASIPGVVRTALQRAEQLVSDESLQLPLGGVAFLTVGGGGEVCRGLAWKWMEGLWTDEPAVWDVLQVGHGPLQTFWEREMTLIALCGTSEPAEALFDRLEGVLDDCRHRMIRLRAAAPGALAVFEHSAGLDRLMVAALEAAPRDLSHWPGKGVDGPLFGLAEPID